MLARITALAPSGLRWRLAGWVTLVTLLCTAVVFVAVYSGTGTQLRAQIDQEVTGDTGELAHAVAAAGSRPPRQVANVAARYVRGQPFSASSTLLFVAVPGVGTVTNRPELFSSHVYPDAGESVSEQARENQLADRLAAAPGGFSTLSLPDVHDLRVLKRVVRLRDGTRVTIGVGEPLAAVVHAQRGVARAFILAGALALVGALLAAYLIGARVSRPLRRMAAVAARVDAGDLHPRLHHVGRPGDEVTVLAEAFNHMLDRLTEAFAGQRAFVADASHELRTPLTVIAGQLEVLAAQESPSAEEVRRVERLVAAEISRVSRLVDDLLLLAKSEQTEFLRVEPVALVDFVAELWDGIELLADRRFELGPIPAGVLRADPDRLAQALRNLVGNAIDHTEVGSGLVRLGAEVAAGGRLSLIVDDDGPGIAPDQRERVFHRFHRTDAARDRASGGTGLGLAIVRAIAEAHGGSARAAQAPTGGARIVLELPGFAPAHDAVAARHQAERPGAGGAQADAADDEAVAVR